MQVSQPEPARAFCNGMEYFNTFGGCTAAGAAGLAVLAALQEEGLQQNALAVGTHLLAGLKALQQVRLKIMHHCQTQQNARLRCTDVLAGLRQL